MRDIVRTTGPNSDRVAGICLVRNSVDLIPFLCGHYLRSGFAHLCFVDDGSHDGTFEYLTKVATRTDRVSVKQVHTETLAHRALVNEAANAMLAAGYRIVVPFDADEFWNAHAGQFIRHFGGVESGVLHGRWVNFVQARLRRGSHWHRLFDMRFQTSLLPNSDPESIAAYTQSFVCHSEMKVALKARKPVELAIGQHGVIGDLEPLNIPALEIFHLPLRSQDEIVKRGADYEPRRAPVRSNPKESWQSAFHAKVVAERKLEAVWAANSYDANGQLDVYGVRVCPGTSSGIAKFSEHEAD
jgi:glycosyltransferase involved in cell wall biosynthesis